MKLSLSDLWSKLPQLTIFLVLLNVVSYYIVGGLYVFILVPTLTIAVYLLYYLFNTSRVRGIVIAILSILILRELAVFFYGYKYGQIVYILLGCIAYGVILIKRLDTIRLFIKDKIAIICTLLFVILNICILNELISQVQDNYVGTFQASFAYILGIIATLLGAVAVLYNQAVNSDRSLTFLFFVFCMIFSDVSSLLGYYFQLYYFYYVDFTFATVGIAFFIHTVLDVKGEYEDKQELKNL